jgi:carbon monoxide dehydrogenase subunit G
MIPFTRASTVKLAGAATLDAPLTRVYAALYEQGVLRQSIPCCESLEPTGDGEYWMTVSVGIATVKGTFSGRVWVEDRQAPGTFSIHTTSAGLIGSVVAGVDVALEDAGERTRLTYAGALNVEGPITVVGGFLMARSARWAAREFFASVNRVFRAEATEPSPSLLRNAT